MSVVVKEAEEIELPPELKKFKKFLRAYVWATREGKIVVLPILHKWGSTIEWSARIHKKGVIGAMEYSDENADLINAGATTKGEVKMTMELLKTEFEVIPTAYKEELAKAIREKYA